MIKNWNYIAIIGIMLITSCADKNGGTPVRWVDAAAPIAAKKAYTRVVHSDTVQDDYYWLNDYFKKGADSSAVVSYLEEENKYTALMMADTEGLQSALFEEMKGRIKEKDESVPYLRNGYYYYSRTEEG